MTDSTHYDALQVSQDANEAVIRAAFDALSRKHHPNNNIGTEQDARARMDRLKDAFEVLSNPIRRATYDLKLRQPTLSFSTGNPPEYAAKRSSPSMSPAWGENSPEPPASAAWNGKEEPQDSRAGSSAVGDAASTPPPASPEPVPQRKTHRLPLFGYVVMACFTGGRQLAIEICKQHGNGLDKLPFGEQLFNAQFWDLMARPTGSLLLGAAIAWALARQVAWLKEWASFVAFAVVLLLCYQAVG